MFTTKALFPGQTNVIEFTATAADANTSDTFFARVYNDANNPTFNECRPENNQSDNVTPTCVE